MAQDDQTKKDGTFFHGEMDRKPGLDDCMQYSYSTTVVCPNVSMAGRTKKSIALSKQRARAGSLTRHG